MALKKVYEHQEKDNHTLCLLTYLSNASILISLLSLSSLSAAKKPKPNRTNDSSIFIFFSLLYFPESSVIFPTTGTFILIKAMSRLRGIILSMAKRKVYQKHTKGFLICRRVKHVFFSFNSWWPGKACFWEVFPARISTAYKQIFENCFVLKCSAGVTTRCDYEKFENTSLPLTEICAQRLKFGDFIVDFY